MFTETFEKPEVQLINNSTRRLLHIGMSILFNLYFLRLLLSSICLSTIIINVYLFVLRTSIQNFSFFLKR